MSSKVINPLDWVPITPEKELYTSYQNTVNTRFPIFGTRDFESAKGDFNSTLLPYDDTGCIDDELLTAIVSNDSFERYKDALSSYLKEHGLQSWLEHEGSLVFGTDHGQFTDVPLTAEALGQINFGERLKTVQVVSKMISSMTLDLGLEEGEFVVLDKLRNISNVGQSVPRLEGNASQELREYRRKSNDLWVDTQEKILDTRGTVIVESLIGRHNVTSKTGNTLYIHEPNNKTFKPLERRTIKLIPLYVYCETFDKDGNYQQADMGFEIYEPVSITDSATQVKEITRMFKDATDRTIGSKYRHGVKVRSWAYQQTSRNIGNVLQRFRPDENPVRSEY